MKVGLDIDGTITAMPWLFKILTEGLRKDGHQIIILTFRDLSFKEETEKMLDEMGVIYDKIFYGKLVIDPEWKAKIVIDENIDVVFEDNSEVLAAMPATVVNCLIIPPWPYRS